MSSGLGTTYLVTERCSQKKMFREIMLIIWQYILPYLIPLLWSACLVIVAVVTRTDSPRLQ
jgi:hypothetical protein